VLPHPRLLLRVQPLFPLLRCPTPPQCPTFIICKPAVDLAIRLAISSLMVFLKVVSRFPMLSSRSVFRSRFPRYRGRPPPRSFTPILPSWRVRTFSLSVRTLRIPRSALALVHLFLTMFLLLHATLARQDTFLQAAANFLWDPQISQVSSFGSPCPLQLDAGPDAASTLFQKISPWPLP
jgi:hypothetical protein